MENELFEKAPVSTAYMKLAVPVILAMVVTMVYNMVDTYFIAMTSNTDLIAGVSLASPIFTLMIALGDILGIGGSSVISRLFGQKDYEKAKRISSLCFFGSIFIGVFMAAVLLLFSKPVLSLLGTSEQTLEYASSYYFWIVLGSPFIILSLTPSNILRTEGFAKEATIGSILGSVVNMILDPIFIFTLNMGAGGAAIATVIGNMVSDLYFIWLIRTKSRHLSASLQDFTCSKEALRAVLSIGIPASTTNFMQTIGITLLNQNLLPFGTNKIAAMGIVMKINMIVVLIMVGAAFGGQPLVGYCVGAKNKDRLMKTIKFAFRLEFILGGVLSAAVILFAPALVSVFLKEADLISDAVLQLRLAQAGMIFIGITLVSTCIFQAGGQGLFALILSLSRQGILYAAVIFAFSRVFGYLGVLCSSAAADFLCALLAVFLLWIWLKKETAKMESAF